MITCCCRVSEGSSTLCKPRVNVSIPWLRRHVRRWGFRPLYPFTFLTLGSKRISFTVTQVFDQFFYNFYFEMYHQNCLKTSYSHLIELLSLFGLWKGTFDPPTVERVMKISYKITFRIVPKWCLCGFLYFSRVWLFFLLHRTSVYYINRYIFWGS